jgi:hypothetical protein
MSELPDRIIAILDSSEDIRTVADQHAQEGDRGMAQKMRILATSVEMRLRTIAIITILQERDIACDELLALVEEQRSACQALFSRIVGISELDLAAESGTIAEEEGGLEAKEKEAFERVHTINAQIRSTKFEMVFQRHPELREIHEMFPGPHSQYKIVYFFGGTAEFVDSGGQVLGTIVLEPDAIHINFLNTETTLNIDSDLMLGGKTLHCTGKLAIGNDTRILGDIDAHSVDSTGTIYGNVRAQEAFIWGDVDGDLFVLGDLTLGASVSGEVIVGRHLDIIYSDTPIVAKGTTRTIELDPSATVSDDFTIESRPLEDYDEESAPAEQAV